MGQVIARQYVEDLEEKYPKELWTMLQFSLQHMIAYWLRTCTPEKTEEMAGHVVCCIMEAVHAATGVVFDLESAAKERLRFPARMKEGGIKKAADTRRPVFRGLYDTRRASEMHRHEDRKLGGNAGVLLGAAYKGDRQGGI